MRWLVAVCSSLRPLMLAGFAGSAAAQGQPLPSADDEAWAAAREMGSAEACQRYLEAFPTGRHAAEAFRCLVESRLDDEPGPVRGGLAVDVY